MGLNYKKWEGKNGNLYIRVKKRMRASNLSFALTDIYSYIQHFTVYTPKVHTTLFLIENELKKKCVQ